MAQLLMVFGALCVCVAMVIALLIVGWSSGFVYPYPPVRLYNRARRVMLEGFIYGLLLIFIGGVV